MLTRKLEKPLAKRIEKQKSPRSRGIIFLTMEISISMMRIAHDQFSAILEDFKGTAVVKML